MSNRLHDLYGLYSDLINGYCSYSFRLIDVAAVDENKIMNANYLALMLIIQKNIYKKAGLPVLHEIMPIIKKMNSNNDDNLILLSLKYLFDSGCEDVEECLKLTLAELSNKVGDGMRTWSEQQRERGFREGMQAGVVQGREEGISLTKQAIIHAMLGNHLPVKFIASLVLIDEIEIERIKSSLVNSETIN